jgi:hypothetical protein
MRSAGFFTVGVCALLSASCAVTPPLSDATNNFPFTQSIPIHDIVQRVKCDLSDALYTKIYKDDVKHQLQWMRSWTAKSDLTLQINESGGISPSFGFTQPLHNAFFLGGGPNSINTSTGAVTNVVSATTQNFTFGIGGNYNVAVTRAENLSFTVSLLELKRWKERPYIDGSTCKPVVPFDLQGSLDLKSWLDEALKPVELGDLAQGIHPDPGSAKAPTAAAAAPAGHGGEFPILPKLPHDLPPHEKARLDLSLTLALNQLGIKYTVPKDPTEGGCVTDSHGVVFVPPPSPNSTGSTQPTNLKSQASTAAQNSFIAQQQASVSDSLSADIRRSIDEAARLTRIETLRVEEASQGAVKFVTQSCKNLYGAAGTCDPAKDGDLAGLLPVAQLSPQFCSRKDYEKFFDQFDKFFHYAELNSNAAQLNGALATRLLTPDPPIESIGQSLNFVVTATASLSPNWNLLYLKGPSNAGPLASVNGIRTHTLNIAMGPPTSPGSQEVVRVLTNQSFRQAVESLRQ